MSKVTAVKNNIGQIDMEFNPALGIMIHIDIFEWSISNFRQSIKIWKKFMGDLDEQGFDIVCAAIKPDDSKLQRFATICGFRKTNEILINPDTTKEYNVWIYKVGDT